MNRTKLVPLLLVTSCMLPKFDIVDSFGDGESGGSGGTAGESAAGGMSHGGAGGSSEAGSPEGGSPEGGAGSAQGGSAGSVGAQGGSNGEAGSAATAGDSAGGTGGSGGTTAGSGGSSGSGGNAGAGGNSPGGSGGTSAGSGGTTAGSGGKGGAGGSGGKGGAGGSGGNGGSGGTGVVVAKAYQYTGSWPERLLAITKKTGTLTYTKIKVSDAFLAQSCAIADYNNDGKPDVSSGRRWYEGPAFTTEHIFRGTPFLTPGHDALPRTGISPEIDTGVSDDFSDYAFDVNGDGWTDIIDISNCDVAEAKNPAPAPSPQPHATAYWYENPKADNVVWPAHLIHSDVRLEQHGFMDVDGDGKPEFYGACKGCPVAQTKGYYQANWSNPGALWTFHPVTRLYEFPFGGTGWLHGMGFGDVTGDGKPDLLERDGVWVDVAAATPNVTPCPGAGCGWIATKFYTPPNSIGGDLGGSHMYAADIDGDGDADVVSADSAHQYGLSWYEQVTPGSFTKRQFMGTPAEIPTYGGISFSQAHALELADMDGDGTPDIITGKSHFAHPEGYGDPDLQGAPVLVVFKGKRGTPSAANGGQVTFEPHQVDAQVGVGHQLAVGHINTDGIMDICVASKLGLYVFLGQ